MIRPTASNRARRSPGSHARQAARALRYKVFLMTIYNVATSGLQESAEIQVYNNLLVAERDNFLKSGVNPPQYIQYTICTYLHFFTYHKIFHLSYTFRPIVLCVFSYYKVSPSVHFFTYYTYTPRFQR